FSDSNCRALDNSVGKFESAGSEHQNSRAVLEVTKLLSLRKALVTVDFSSATVPEIERRTDEMQPDTGDQNRGDGHERQERVRRGQFKRQNGALILAEEFFNAVERDGIDIPGISGDVSHAADRAVARRVETVIHTCAETKRDELAAPVTLDEAVIAQQ